MNECSGALGFTLGNWLSRKGKRKNLPKYFSTRMLLELQKDIYLEAHCVDALTWPREGLILVLGCVCFVCVYCSQTNVRRLRVQHCSAYLPPVRCLCVSKSCLCLTVQVKYPSSSEPFLTSNSPLALIVSDTSPSPSNHHCHVYFITINVGSGFLWRPKHLMWSVTWNRHPTASCGINLAELNGQGLHGFGILVQLLV